MLRYPKEGEGIFGWSGWGEDEEGREGKDLLYKGALGLVWRDNETLQIEGGVLTKN